MREPKTWLGPLLVAAACGIAGEARALNVATNDGVPNIHGVTRKTNLTYCESGLSQQTSDVVRRAMREWELAANVRFIHLRQHDDDPATQQDECTAARDAGSAFFTVEMGQCPNGLFGIIGEASGQSQTVACGFFPDAPLGQRHLIIEPHFSWARLPDTVVHELGHVLGFRHEFLGNVDDDGRCTKPEGGTFQQLTTYDNASVMEVDCQTKSLLHYFEHLTPRDIQGAAATYGPSRVQPIALRDESGKYLTQVPSYADRLVSYLPGVSALTRLDLIHYEGDHFLLRGPDGRFASAANGDELQFVDCFNCNGKFEKNALFRVKFYRDQAVAISTFNGWFLRVNAGRILAATDRTEASAARFQLLRYDANPTVLRTENTYLQLPQIEREGLLQQANGDIVPYAPKLALDQDGASPIYIGDLTSGETRHQFVYSGADHMRRQEARFYRIWTSPTTFGILAPNGQFLWNGWRGDQPLQATCSMLQAECAFTLVRLADGSSAIQTSHGTFLKWARNGREPVMASATSLGDATAFHALDLLGDLVRLLHDGEHVLWAKSGGGDEVVSLDKDWATNHEYTVLRWIHYAPGAAYNPVAFTSLNNQFLSLHSASKPSAAYWNDPLRADRDSMGYRQIFGHYAVGPMRSFWTGYQGVLHWAAHDTQFNPVVADYGNDDGKFAVEDAGSAAYSGSLAIPDAGAGTAVAIASYPYPVPVHTASFRLELEHADVSELSIEVVSPEGRAAQLRSSPGASGTKIDEWVATEAFRGVRSEGDWTLRVTDHQAQKTGKLKAFEVRIE